MKSKLCFAILWFISMSTKCTIGTDSGEEITVFVGYAGNTAVYINTNAYVRELRKKVEKALTGQHHYAEGHYLRLMFGGKELKDYQQLCKIGIGERSHIHFIWVSMPLDYTQDWVTRNLPQEIELVYGLGFKDDADVKKVMNDIYSAEKQAEIKDDVDKTEWRERELQINKDRLAALLSVIRKEDEDEIYSR